MASLSELWILSPIAILPAGYLITKYILNPRWDRKTLERLAELESRYEDLYGKKPNRPTPNPKCPINDDPDIRKYMDTLKRAVDMRAWNLE